MKKKTGTKDYQKYADEKYNSWNCQNGLFYTNEEIILYFNFKSKYNSWIIILSTWNQYEVV